MRVAIVGGGIVGLASAYYLADRDVSVAVYEKDSIGGGSTGRANGGIRAQFTSPIHVRFSRESMPVWGSFEKTFGVEIGYRRTGYLFLARTEGTAEHLRENVARQNDLGVPSDYLSPSEAIEHCPGLYADRYVGAAYSPTDGFADPHLALQGFLRGAGEAGAEIHTGVEVTDLQVRDGRVERIETEDGVSEVDFVVNAAGPWAGEIAEMVGLDLPVSPRRRQLLLAEPEPPLPPDAPMTVDVDESVHFRPESDGAAIVGGRNADGDPEHDPDRYRTSNDPDWTVDTLERAADVATYFGPETAVVRGWAGLYTVTPDHHPIVEEPIPGFVNAVGFSGHGFMHAPATGQVVAELILDDTPETVDVSPLSADRFERDAELHEGTVID
ncbi:sarcosine oxidase, subunit beta [Halalkaliarchaeum desulfuricum]|uniref:Sarcosine oxidase, subunit beta n=1 Tax=Halalkaliarchaeum desulfuricum TaxID=2055893 RepID=A0A343TFM6_9EURY|nr:FAD-dependent oxidoreductase [Halalkaliarchaeum desulfuricum]AUX07898.1 sarcosine oxidase, subunit beta [Halalkaliarchaeum desulfuricum]